MAAHALHSLSGSKRRYACPGSVVLEADFPDTSGKYAAEGTAMHDVAAWCLTEHRRAESRIAEMIRVGGTDAEPEYVEFTDDMAELTQGYVDTVRVLGIDNVMLIEKRVDVSEITGISEQFGTADCIIYDKRVGELMVIDLKTGYRPVSPVGNTQLQLYALGALKLLIDGNLTATPPVPRADAGDAGQPDPGLVGTAAQAADAGTTQEAETEDDLW